MRRSRLSLTPRRDRDSGPIRAGLPIRVVHERYRSAARQRVQSWIVGSHRETRATRLATLLDQLDGSLREGDVTDLLATPTGFKVLDETVGGGLRAGDLIMLGGPPGVGKTIAALQMAREIALQGGHALFICYEHEESVLATRLLALETAEVGGSEQTASRIASLLLRGAEGRQSLVETLAADPIVAEALSRMRSYADRLVLIRASGAHTTLDQIGILVDAHTTEDTSPVVFVDYLQKVPVQPEPPTESEKVTRTVEGLKDLALSYHLPVVVISAVDGAGLEARRLRLHHLRGSSAVAFEADVVLMLNDKSKAVSKVHLAYDAVRAKTFRDWVVMSVEKNRGGPNLIDLEFRKDFSHFRFEPDGGIVTEKLVDERMEDDLI